MSKMKARWCLFLLSAVIGAGALADGHGEWDGSQPPAGRPVAENAAPKVVGCITKDNKGESVTYDLQIGNERNHYEMKGATSPDQGFYRSDVEVDGVRVLKRSIDNGLTRLEEFRNSGQTKIYPRKRFVDGQTLAGVPVSGYTVQKLFTNSLTMDHLSVDGKAASGKLFYNILNGRYTCPAGRCKFGDYVIQSTEGTNTVLNYDNFLINKNRMRMTMQFGDWKLNGLVKFNDTTRTHVDSDGNSSTEVVATRGCFNVDISKLDGSAPKFGVAEKNSTSDDATARHLLAWLQLMSYDLFAE